MKGTLVHTSVLVNPSRALVNYICSLKLPNNVPLGISGLHSKQVVNNSKRKQTKLTYYLNNEDRRLIDKLNFQSEYVPQTYSNSDSNSEDLLNLEDLYWIYNYIQEDNKSKDISERLYFHELFKGSKIVFPENEDIPRNEELEKRCEKLRTQQQNSEYKKITKDVDSMRRKLPEDTVSYQLKQLNKQLIAIAQFVLSVAAGFAFGFIGIELMIGNLDFGFRLLLGIISALVIALAELYFLAKKLNEDSQYDIFVKEKSFHSKVD